MLNLTRLLADTIGESDSLRYHSRSRYQVHGAADGCGPVVVWNSTAICNLECIHCYANAKFYPSQQELNTWESERLIDDLAEFKVPVLLFSGGEPLMRQDLFHLIKYSVSKSIMPVISTNGTLIDYGMAEKIKHAGVRYVGISLDGFAENNDYFRGRKGSFQKALDGIRNCLAVGQKVGLRFTLSKHTYGDLEDIFELIKREAIPRACFYHFVPSGRGSITKDISLSSDETREAISLIINKAIEFNEKGLHTEILTVDNHADSVYLYRWLRQREKSKAEKILKLLQNNGGNRSGIAFANIDCEGNVHPDQFSSTVVFGNVRERPFSEIWQDISHPVMAGLKDRKDLLKGRCGMCKWLHLCNGNFRARALAVSGDYWASDPGCYLADNEIGIVYG